MLISILVLALLICMFATAMRRMAEPSANLRLRLAALGICLIQLAAQGPRLELVPAYLVAGVFAVLVAVDMTRKLPATAANPSIQGLPPSRSRRAFVRMLVRWTGIAGGTLALLLAALLCLAFDSFEYPAPTGPYAVGTSKFRLTDTAREELLTERSGDYRQILVRVTYPASHDDSFARLPRDTIQGMAAVVTGAIWPNPVTVSWGATVTHARRDALLAATQQRYPVLIYSHGMGGNAEMNTVLTQHLASHGYVVMAIDHPFLNSGFRFEDGTMIGAESLFDSQFSNTEEQDRKREELAVLIENSRDAPVARLAELIRERAAVNRPQDARWTRLHELMSADQSFLLDSLNSLPPGSQVAGRLDLDRIGVFGMSSGGTTTHLTCTRDPRCRAGLNLDGFQPFLIDLPPLRVPFMHMGSERNFQLAIAHESAEAKSYLVSIRGTEHPSFTDYVLSLHRLRSVSNMLGTIDGERMLSLVNDYVLAFFDKTLLGRKESILDGVTSDRYPEVVMLSKE
jgi:predicted dienelactone hydrolase